MKEISNDRFKWKPLKPVLTALALGALMLGSAPQASAQMKVGDQGWFSYAGDYTVSYPFASGASYTPGSNPWQAQAMTDIGTNNTWRFMDWGCTNNNENAAWTDRKLPSNTDQSGPYNGGEWQWAPPNNWTDTGTPPAKGQGMAYEWMVDECNRANVNMWICIPHKADDNYVTKLAQLIRFGSDGTNPYTSTQGSPTWAPLKPNLNLYIEYSNEVWNYGFDQEHWCDQQGVAQGLGDHQHFYGRRVAQIGNIFYSVWTGSTSRLVRVLGTQCVPDTSIEATELAQCQADGGAVDALAVAPYWDPGDGASASYQTNGQNAINAQLTVIDAKKTWTNAHGLQLVCYEAGQGCTTNADQGRRQASNFTLYQNYLDGLQAHGVSLVNLYAHVGTPGTGNAWGAKEFWGQATSASPSWNGITTWIANHPGSGNPGAGGGIPAVPVGVTASAGDTQVVLNWTASTGATAYDVKRSTVSGSGYATISSPATNSYTNTGLTDGTTYYYVLDAKNASGTSGNSSQVSATPFAPIQANIANAATAPTIDGNNTDAIWSSATSYSLTHLLGTLPSGQSFAASYQAAWDNTNLYVLVTVTDSTLLKYVTNPWDGDSVEVYIDADNNKSTSYDSNDYQYELPWNSTTIVETKHSATTGVVFGQMNISGGYRIEVKFPWTTLGVTPAANNLIGLEIGINNADTTAGTRDCQRFWADSTGLDWSNPALFGVGKLLAGGGGAPPAPTGLTATAGNAQVALSWTASSGATSYNMLRSTVSGSGYASVATGIATTAYTNTGLTNGTTYYFVVTATNANGTSGNSNQASATPQVGAPPAPTGLTATGGNAQVALSWTASSGATSYNVSWSTVSGSGYASVATGIAVVSYTNTGLTNGTTYYFVVSATNAGGTSANSAQANATPVAGSSGLIKINAAGPAVSPFVADVDFSGGLTATNWTGTIDTSAVASPAPQAVYQSERYGAMTYTIGGLTSGTSYTVRLHFCENYFTASGLRTFTVAINSTTVLTNFDIFATSGAIHKANCQQFNTTGNSSGQVVIVFTNVVNNALINGIEVNAASAPAAPTGLSAAPGNAQIALSWTASSGATSYNVKRSTVNGSGYATVSSPTTTSYTNTGLTNGTTYYYVVTAVNAGGESGNSSQVSATPSAGGTATLNPTADRDNQSDNAAGTNPTINVSQWDNPYYKFDLTSITGSITSAKLRIYRLDTTVGSATFNAHQAVDTWTENGTVPGLGTIITSVTNNAIGYIEFDVTSYVNSQYTGDKTASFGLDNAAGGWTGVTARESATNKPQLVIIHS